MYDKFTNLIDQELKLDYRCSRVMLTVAFNPWSTKTDINFNKEYKLKIGTFTENKAEFMPSITF